MLFTILPLCSENNALRYFSLSSFFDPHILFNM